jgi:hypothetical protein
LSIPFFIVIDKFLTDFYRNVAIAIQFSFRPVMGVPWQPNTPDLDSELPGGGSYATRRFGIRLDRPSPSPSSPHRLSLSTTPCTTAHPPSPHLSPARILLQLSKLHSDPTKAAIKSSLYSRHRRIPTTACRPEPLPHPRADPHHKPRRRTPTRLAYVAISVLPPRRNRVGPVVFTPTEVSGNLYFEV